MWHLGNLVWVSGEFELPEFEVLSALRGSATEKHVPLILIGVLECFFRVEGLAFVHYTCYYRDGKKKHFYLIMWKQFNQEDKGGESQEPTGKKVLCLN